MIPNAMIRQYAAGQQIDAEVAGLDIVPSPTSTPTAAEHSSCRSATAWTRFSNPVICRSPSSPTSRAWSAASRPSMGWTPTR
jgi:hypothetical protein